MKDFLDTLAIPPGVIGWRVCRSTVATVKVGRSYTNVVRMEYATGARTWAYAQRRGKPKEYAVEVAMVFVRVAQTARPA